MADTVAEMEMSKNGGRIFVAPGSVCEDNKAEVWVCIGSPFSNEVQFVPYDGILQPICAKDKYEHAINEVLKVMKAEAPHHNRGCCGGRCQKCCLAVADKCACCIGCATCLCCCCIACCAPLIVGCIGSQVADVAVLLQKQSNAIEKASEKLKEVTSDWPTTVKLEWLDKEPSELTGAAAVDQFGKRLENREGKAIWGPSGVQLIFIAPEGIDLASKWPPQPGQAQMIGK